MSLVGTRPILQDELRQYELHHRARIAIKQKDLSAKTGITQADISRIENGTRNPSLSMVKKLAQGLERV